ncbi:hypothetical protein RH831_10960 [Halodesulfurarchaeum sp. HSR-GB]|uniref:hypothetical protein n=1 Tax=Halodesulfurarchaeum sp. HSR-GB TaxID=3074077 RepID=UPI002865726B|nr:hypothetical protein [Halodesulfurarchaeum sp. HSR-GB]MDR5657695.1 hypothetical protein [Halodesulfurarchaeum sp. HSR-GB]
MAIIVGINGQSGDIWYWYVNVSLMKRREYLAGAAVAISALAGCSGFSGGPKYEPGEKETLLPDEVGEDWPDQDLEPRHEEYEDYDRVWRTSDLSVFMWVNIYDKTEGAKDEFSRQESLATNVDDYPLAEEAIISDNGEFARCTFRDSNAVGQVISARLNGSEAVPNRGAAGRYAEYMYAEWPGIEE